MNRRTELIGLMVLAGGHCAQRGSVVPADTGTGWDTHGRKGGHEFCRLPASGGCAYRHRVSGCLAAACRQPSRATDRFFAGDGCGHLPRQPSDRRPQGRDRGDARRAGGVGGAVPRDPPRARRCDRASGDVTVPPGGDSDSPGNRALREGRVTRPLHFFAGAASPDGAAAGVLASFGTFLAFTEPFAWVKLYWSLAYDSFLGDSTVTVWTSPGCRSPST